MMSWKWTAGVVVLAMGLLGCATEKVEVPPTKEVVVSNAPSEAGGSLSETVAVGKAAPDFEIFDENGKSWKLSDYRGKTVLLDFWGFWCPYCVRELPELRNYHDELEAKGLVLIGMNNDSEPVGEIKKQLAKSVVNWRQGMIGDGHELDKDYDVSAYPTKVLIDPDGMVVYIDNIIDQTTIEKHLPKSVN
jgi:peroxiredoxin